MIQKLRISLLSLSLLALVGAFGLGGNVFAADPPPGTQAKPQQAVCKGARTLKVSTSTPGDTNCDDTNDVNANKVNDLIAQIVNIFSVIVGIIAVIMIIYGGLKYITSGGDSGRITSAKNTILYALIGLIIVALAQFVVRFVLSKTTGTVDSGSSDESMIRLLNNLVA